MFVRKKSTAKPIPLQPLPTTDQPNQRIHIDLFGPLKTSAQGNKMVLVMTDAFTKYAEAIAIPNKEEFSSIGFADLDRQCKFIQTMAQNLLTNSVRNFSNC
jgi:hypothetical protein